MGLSGIFVRPLPRFASVSSANQVAISPPKFVFSDDRLVLLLLFKGEHIIALRLFLDKLIDINIRGGPKDAEPEVAAHIRGRVPGTQARFKVGPIFWEPSSEPLDPITKQTVNVLFVRNGRRVAGARCGKRRAIKGGLNLLISNFSRRSRRASFGNCYPDNQRSSEREDYRNANKKIPDSMRNSRSRIAINKFKTLYREHLTLQNTFQDTQRLQSP